MSIDDADQTYRKRKKSVLVRNTIENSQKR